jgi:recombination protein RecA
VVKNKVAPPFKYTEFDMMFDHGISKEGDILDLGVEMGMIKKSGAFFSFGDIRLGQGRENAKDYLVQNLDIAREIEQRIRATICAPGGVLSTTDSDENHHRHQVPEAEQTAGESLS